MDTTLFSDKSPGQLVSISGGESAFVPHPLPPDWKFPTRLWPLLSDAKQRIGILEGLGRNLLNPEILLRPLQDREAILSSSLEGTFATPQELFLFELDPREAVSAEDPLNARREVANYATALRSGLASPLPLSLRLIRDMHRELLTGVRGRERSPGEFRRGQVHIGHDKRFIPPPANRLRECLEAMQAYFHQDDSGFDALVRCYLVHYQFETIHPFYDGNGRVGRLLLALMLQQWCGMTKPWLYMSAFFDRNKDEYIQRLFEVSTRRDWEGWIEFCLQGTVARAEDTIRRCDGLLSLRSEYQGRLRSTGGSVRLSQIVDGLFQAPIVRVASLARSLDVTYPTARADIDRLVEAGILWGLATPGRKAFYASEILRIAFDEETSAR